MPTISDFFANPAFTAAYNREQRGDKPFLELYKELTQKYKSLLNKNWSEINSEGGNFNEVVMSARDAAVSLCDRIVEVQRLYLKGDIFGAYEKLAKCLANGKYELKNNLLLSVDTVRLFRMRVADTPASDIKKREDIFHTPFSKRHIIGTNRFSIPGYPCLYLGSSLYVCWEEMGRPPLHKIAFSRFEPVQNTDSFQNLVYLNVSPKVLEESSVWNNIFHFRDSIDGLCNYLRIYPLQLACAIPCRHIGNETKFREEYIIPQLLMQWIRKNSIYYGVCFRTTRVPQVLTNSHFFANIQSLPNKFLAKELILFNYAYPARQTNKEFCTDLANSFYFTDPISFEMSLGCSPRSPDCSLPRCLSMVNNKQVLSGLEEFYNNWCKVPFSMGTNTATFYECTDFNEAERNSCCFPAMPLY